MILYLRKNKLEEQLKLHRGELVSVSGGGDPLYNYDCSSNKRFYDKLFKLINSDTMSNGKWEPVKFNGRDGWKFLSWKWLNAEEKIIVVVNFSDAKGEGNVVRKDIFDTANKVLEEVKL